MPNTGTPVFKTGSLVTTAVTADQVIVTREVSPGSSFVLEFLEVNVRLTTFAATATNFGTVSLETPSGTKLLTFLCAGPGVLNSPIYVELPDPLAVVGNSDGKTVIRVVVTPAATTSFTWEANLVGYER